MEQVLPEAKGHIGCSSFCAIHSVSDLDPDTLPLAGPKVTSRGWWGRGHLAARQRFDSREDSNIGNLWFYRKEIIICYYNFIFMNVRGFFQHMKTSRTGRICVCVCVWLWIDKFVNLICTVALVNECVVSECVHLVYLDMRVKGLWVSRYMYIWVAHDSEWVRSCIHECQRVLSESPPTEMNILWVSEYVHGNMNVAVFFFSEHTHVDMSVLWVCVSAHR